MGEALITRRGGGGDVQGVTLKKVMDVVNFTGHGTELRLPHDSWRNVIEEGKNYKLCINISGAEGANSTESKRARIEVFVMYGLYSGNPYLTHTGGGYCTAFTVGNESGLATTAGVAVKLSTSSTRITLELSGTNHLKFPTDVSKYQIVLYEVEF